MDRDTRWDRIQRAYDLFVQGKAAIATNPETALENAYENGQTDEFVEPVRTMMWWSFSISGQTVPGKLPGLLPKRILQDLPDSRHPEFPISCA